MGKEEYNFVAQCVSDALTQLQQDKIDKQAIIRQIALDKLVCEELERAKERHYKRIPKKVAKADWKKYCEEQGIKAWKPKRII